MPAYQIEERPASETIVEFRSVVSQARSAGLEPATPGSEDALENPAEEPKNSAIPGL